jgi:hypothetical protein
MWERVTGWRFWTLVGITVVDSLIFVIPIALGALVVGAVVAPDWLRRAARFLDALADGR